MSFARNFAAGQQIAQSAMDAYDNAKMGSILKEAKDAKAESLQQFSEGDAAQLHSAAEGGQQVQWDEEAGGYTVQPVVQPAAVITPSAVPDAEPAAASKAAPTPMGPPQVFKPQEHTRFLGTSTAGKLSDEQIKEARASHIESRTSDLFNPVRGLKMVNSLKADEREDFKFGLVKTEAARQAQELKTKEAGDKAEQAYFANTPTAKALGDHAKATQDWQAAVQQHQADVAAGKPVGQEPAPPMFAPPPITAGLADILGSMHARVAAGGKPDLPKMIEAGALLQKARDDGTVAALRAAQEGGPLQAVLNKLKQSGRESINLENVVSDDMVQRPDGVSTRRITYTDPTTGQTATIDTMADLSALGQAGEYYKRLTDGLEAQDKRLLRKSQIDYNNARASAAGQKAGGAAPTSSAATTGAAPAPNDSARMKQVEGIFKEYKSDDPTGWADAFRVAKDSLALNPGADPALVAYAAQSAVVGDPKNLQTKLDFGSGRAVSVYTDQRTGAQIKMHHVKPRQEEIPALKAEVKTYLAELDKLGAGFGGDTKWSEVMVRAASNPQDPSALEGVLSNEIVKTTRAFQQNLEQANAQRRAAGLPENPMPKFDVIAAKAAQAVKSPNGLAEIKSRIQLIRDYGLN